jgi:hypothetical protein
MRQLHAFILAIATVSLIAACSTTSAPTASPSPLGWVNQGSGDLVPITVNSELVVGSNRFLLNLVDRRNEPLASPNRRATLKFYDLSVDQSAPAVSVVGTYMLIIDGLPGLYRGQVDFAHAGQWGLEVVTDEPDGSQRTGRLSFPVRETGTTPVVGAPAPPSETPTATTADGIKQISTDGDPDADFYQLSVKQALAEHHPFLLIFATPAFCRSATCGPALEVVKSLAPEFKDRVAFIHVEPYQLQLVGGQLQPVIDARNNPIPVQAVDEWGLPTEPYVFVVDAEGKVRAKFEGVAGADEIRQALTAIAP